MRLTIHIILIIASFVLIPMANPESFETAAMLWGNFFLQIFITSLYCKRDLEKDAAKNKK